MGTWGTAGASARDGYRAASGRRGRAVAQRWVVLLLVGGAGGGVAVTGIHGSARLAVLATVGVVFVAAVLWDPDPDPERWLRGADGEVRTAVLLEALPARRWHVFHDLRVPGSTANIDHLVIGRSGVWVIDTKTTRAPVRVGFTSIRLGDRPLNTGSVRWQAEVVSARLGIAARPLIVLHPGPGSSRGARSLTDAGPDKRWLPRRGVSRRGVRVVLAADMVRRLKRGRRRLARWEVEQAAGEVLCSFRQASGQTGSISQPATARRPARITQPYRMS